MPPRRAAGLKSRPDFPIRGLMRLVAKDDWAGEVKGRCATAPDGFTLVEVVIALVLVMIVGLAWATVAVQADKGLSLARQRQWASGAATQALEELRALPYQTVVAGLGPGDIGGDPYLVPAGTGHHLSLPSAVTGAPTDIDEVLQESGTSAAPAPLYPHVSTPPGTPPSSFPSPPSLSVYVTQDPSQAGVYLLTALVGWRSPDGTQRMVIQRTRLFSPPGSGGA
jgi:type II secretory pathway pseudopilin PulG